MKHQDGFTLMEILMAMALASLLSLILFQVLRAIKRTDQLNLTLIEMQQQGRLATDFLAQKIRLAGYRACDPEKSSLDNGYAIHGYTAQTISKNWGVHALFNTNALVVAECDFYQGREQWLERIFFIADTNRVHENGKPIYALFSKIFSGEREELVPEIDNLTVRYGVTTSDQKNIAAYLSAEEISAWKSVRAVQLELTLHSDKIFQQWPIYVALRF